MRPFAVPVRSRCSSMQSWSTSIARNSGPNIPDRMVMPMPAADSGAAESAGGTPGHRGTNGRQRERRTPQTCAPNRIPLRATGSLLLVSVPLPRSATPAHASPRPVADAVLVAGRIAVLIGRAELPPALMPLSTASHRCASNTHEAHKQERKCQHLEMPCCAAVHGSWYGFSRDPYLDAESAGSTGFFAAR